MKERLIKFLKGRGFLVRSLNLLNAICEFVEEELRGKPEIKNLQEENEKLKGEIRAAHVYDECDYRDKKIQDLEKINAELRDDLETAARENLELRYKVFTQDVMPNTPNPVGTIVVDEGILGPYLKEITDLKGKITELEKHNARLERSLDAKELAKNPPIDMGWVEPYRKEITDLKVKVAQLELAKNQHGQYLQPVMETEKLYKENRLLTEEVARLKDIADNTLRIRDERDTLKAGAAGFDKTRDVILKLKVRIAELYKENKSLAEEVARLKEAVQEINTNSANLLNKITANKNSEIEKLTNDLTVITERFDDSQKKRMVLRNERDTLLQKLNVAERTIEQTEAYNQNLLAANRELNQKNIYLNNSAEEDYKKIKAIKSIIS